MILARRIPGPITLAMLLSIHRSGMGRYQPPRYMVDAIAANANVEATSPRKNDRKRNPEYSVM